MKRISKFLGNVKDTIFPDGPESISSQRSSSERLCEEEDDEEMMSRNGSLTAGPSGRVMPTTIKPKKKPPPPRPPQPKINRLQTSTSFNTAHDLGVRTGKDLIDFTTPPGSPAGIGRRNTVATLTSTLKDPNDFSYRVGASVFYIKSPLKNSIPQAPVQNPFSPPRPTADSQQRAGAAAVTVPANLNDAWNSPVKRTTNTVSTWDTPAATNPNGFQMKQAAPSVASSSVINSQFQNTSSLENNNSIKSNYQAASPWSPVGASSKSNAGSGDRTSAALSDFGTSQSRYSNVPENFKKELSATLSSGNGAGSKPTIIRPVNNKPTGPSSDGSAAVSVKSVVSSLQNAKNDSDNVTVQRNYYDVPPDDFDDDFDESNDDDSDINNSSFMSPPMPSEPPPPPPPEVAAVDEWVNSTTGGAGVADYPDTSSDSGPGISYAIAVYDFKPESEGDLLLQAGDLVYLIRRIDDSWLYGSCGGMEGMFPSNFVNVMAPLPEETAQNESETDIYTDVLYDFSPEADGDLGLQAGEKIKVIGRINEDWLYGEKDGTKGQFPAAFVQQIFQDLPVIQI